MRKNALIAIILVSLVLILVAGFLVITLTGRVIQRGNADNQIVDCSKSENPTCFSDRMNSCLPVSVKITGINEAVIELIILGEENETCHFQRKINNDLQVDCSFPKGTMNWSNLGNLIGQTFGDDRGLQDVVDHSCRNV